MAEYPTVRNLVLLTGSNDENGYLQFSKKDSTGLINTMRPLDSAVFISGPVPPIRGGAERFNSVFISMCYIYNLHFVNNFHIFERTKTSF